MKHITLLILTLLSIVASASDKVRVGLAWQPNASANARVVQVIEIAGGEAVLLDQVRAVGLDYDSTTLSSYYVDKNGVLLESYAQAVKHHTWKGSNVEEVMRDVDAVVFLGGGDISSTLLQIPQSWHGLPDDNNCNATRDISEYLTMTYCLDHNIPILGLCRGMQMLGVVSGASLIQDLCTYFATKGIEYTNLHRSLRDKNGNRHYTPHDVIITDSRSHLYSIVIGDTIKNVPSWHHQVVGDVTGTHLKVTGITYTQGENIIEAIERTDQTFALGVQFHPEEAVKKHLAKEDDAINFMQLYEGVNFFRALINYSKTLKNQKK